VPKLSAPAVLDAWDLSALMHPTRSGPLAAFITGDILQEQSLTGAYNQGRFTHGETHQLLSKQ
jgi:hypothetical protein